MDDNKEKTNLHEDHRKRLKERYISNGLNGFSSHEIIELLLFYSIPRKDTNAIAHELIKKFGSIDKVFDADISEICKINGISEHTALLLKLIPDLSRTYIAEKQKDVRKFTSLKQLGRYCITKFIGSCTESVYAIYFDNSMRIIDCIKLNDGDVNETQISIRRLVSNALTKNASYVVMTHNHPGGKAFPSDADLSVTRTAKAALGNVGVSLSEHFVVADNSYTGIINDVREYSVELC